MRGTPSPVFLFVLEFGFEGFGFGGSGFFVTVTPQEADNVLPSVVIAVIVAVPGFTALTVPLETVATAVLLDFQFNFLLAASVGRIEYFTDPDCPS